MVGQTISHYQILAKLGEGGMGVVYQAQDTKLDRTVALKFLPGHFLGNEEVRKRFEREAKAAAALQHPNICPVFEIDEFEGRSFIAMALIEGQSLDKKIAQGPLKLDEALAIAQQIAKGLEAAHKKGIIHRDIKPENIMVGEDHHVTIMDFGLAQLTEASRLTKTDETLGTVAYMSPEQTQGSGTDHRTDIWSLGVVLYEMITGQQPFKGDYDKAVMYSILNEHHEPITGIRAGMPMELEVMVGKCLAKNPGERYKDAADVAVDLSTLGKKVVSGRSTIVAALSSPTIGAERGGQPAADSTRWPRALPWTLAGLLAVALAALSFVQFRQPAAQKPLSRFSFTPESMWQSDIQTTAISPNGRHIAFVSDVASSAAGDRMLWVRDLDRREIRMLEDSAGARTPFWSPDSRLIAFATDTALKKVAVEGGPVINLCDLPGTVFDGGAWSPDGSTILVSTAQGPPTVVEVSANGGALRPFPLEGSTKGPGIQTPHFLPQGLGPRGLVYSAGSRDIRDLFVKNLETGETSRLVEGLFPAYSSSGHILYQASMNDARLWALPFSLQRLEPAGEPFVVAEAAVDPSAAEDGTLVYADPSHPLQRLVWRDRQGRKLADIGQPQRQILDPALAPNQTSVAVAGLDENGYDVWIHQVNRSMKRRLTTFEGVDGSPEWAPSGKEIAYRSNRSGGGDIYLISADGTGAPEKLVGSDFYDLPSDWSRDGAFLLYSSFGNPQSRADISYLKRTEGERFVSVPFLSSPFDELNGKFSPDGKFVAYCSNESGRYEAYVRQFPSGAGLVQISENGGCQARWGENGKEIFYVEGSTLMAARVSLADGFHVVSTEALFTDPHFVVDNPSYQSYEVSPDASRFILPESAQIEQDTARSIHIVQNWYEEFRGRKQD